ncbi:hypothetical protein B0H10DRAFT_745531 [Mycena sp. CBHHK59/15]|nr:hypothetical protein B0H10DRAFT_745531 [Mycena sp. CBHHK59/15]
MLSTGTAYRAGFEPIRDLPSLATLLPCAAFLQLSFQFYIIHAAFQSESLDAEPDELVAHGGPFWTSERTRPPRTGDPALAVAVGHIVQLGGYQEQSRYTHILRVGVTTPTRPTTRSRPPGPQPRGRTRKSGGRSAAPRAGPATRGGGACSARGRVCSRRRCSAFGNRPSHPLPPRTSHQCRQPHACLVSWFLDAPSAQFGVHCMALAGKV